jgi:hypothetical protein
MTMLSNMHLGFKKLEPIKYTRSIRRAGFMCWYWIIECKFSTATNGPFWTRKGAAADMARYPL